MSNDVDFITGRKTSDIFGISRYANELEKHAHSFKFRRIEYPYLSKNHIIDGGVREFVYPLIIKAKLRKKAVHHISSQHLAKFLNYIPMDKSIVTCHDLIPWCYEKNHSIQWKLNIRGLIKAFSIITDSKFSKREILNETHVLEEKVHVIPLGVDHDCYQPLKNRELLKEEYVSSQGWPILLYVGSEEPRKNLPNLIKALSLLKIQFPNFKFIKAGSSQFGGQRKELQNLIKFLDLEKNVIFTGNVSEKELPLFYNIADAFIFPSFYEGFGFPPLESMACGCPVIVSDSTSLPEVVGDAGVYIDPNNPQSIADGIWAVLDDETLRKNMVQKGISQARKFSWKKTAKLTESVYQEVLSI